MLKGVPHFAAWSEGRVKSGAPSAPKSQKCQKRPGPLLTLAKSKVSKVHAFEKAPKSSKASQKCLLVGACPTLPSWKIFEQKENILICCRARREESKKVIAVV